MANAGKMFETLANALREFDPAFQQQKAQEASAEQDLRRRLEFQQKMQQFKSDAETTALKKKAKATAEANLGAAGLLEEADDNPDFDFDDAQVRLGAMSDVTSSTRREVDDQLEQRKKAQVRQASSQQIKALMDEFDAHARLSALVPPGKKPTRQDIRRVRSRIAGVEGAPEERDEALKQIVFPPTAGKLSALGEKEQIIDAAAEVLNWTPEEIAQAKLRIAGGAPPRAPQPTAISELRALRDSKQITQAQYIESLLKKGTRKMSRG